MLVVFLDRPSDDFTSCFNVDSYGEVPLFDKNLFSCMKSSVYPLIEDEYIVFSDNKKAYKCEDNVLCDINELYNYIVESRHNSISFFSLDTIIDIDCVKILSSDFEDKNVRFCDKNGMAFGLQISKNLIKSDFDLFEKIVHRNFGCFEKFLPFESISIGEKLSNIKVYKRLVDQMMNFDYRENLPETAQGIYSSGRIPSGEYTIIPPVYFGKDIQIESGAVIGPGTVIYDSSLVSRNSIVENSVLLGNCYISKDCFLENCICCSNVSVRRASSILSGAIIGTNAMLSEKSNIEKDNCIFEITVDNKGFKRIIKKYSEAYEIKKDDLFYEINDGSFNIKCEKIQGDSLRILLRTASFETAEEIISDIRSE